MSKSRAAAGRGFDQRWFWVGRRLSNTPCDWCTATAEIAMSLGRFEVLSFSRGGDRICVERMMETIRRAQDAPAAPAVR